MGLTNSYCPHWVEFLWGPHHGQPIVGLLLGQVPSHGPISGSAFLLDEP